MLGTGSSRWSKQDSADQPHHDSRQAPAVAPRPPPRPGTELPSRSVLFMMNPKPVFAPSGTPSYIPSTHPTFGSTLVPYTPFGQLPAVSSLSFQGGVFLPTPAGVAPPIPTYPSIVPPNFPFILPQYSPFSAPFTPPALLASSGVSSLPKDFVLPQKKFVKISASSVPVTITRPPLVEVSLARTEFKPKADLSAPVPSIQVVPVPSLGIAPVVDPISISAPAIVASAAPISSPVVPAVFAATPAAVPPVSNPKANMSEPFVNPYAAFVKEHDPTGTMGDGRIYVGRPSHHLDRPLSNRSQSAPKAGVRPSPAPRRSAPPPPAKKAVPTSQVPSPSSPRYSAKLSSRDQSQSRWQGIPLATTASLTPARPPNQGSEQSRWIPGSLATGTSVSADFFQTSRPSVSTLTSVSGRSSQATSDSSSLNPVSPRRAPTNIPPALSSPQPTPVMSRQIQAGFFGTAKPVVPLATNENVHVRQATDPVVRTLGDSIQRLSIASPKGADEDGEEWVKKKRAEEINPGRPLVIQHPMGDGAWATIAIHVERSASEASKHFPELRARQSCGYKPKTIRQIADIVEEVLQEEKDSLLGYN